MPTIVHKLGEENKRDWGMLHDAYIGGFLHGDCYAFAIALHQGLGWQIVGLIRNEQGRDRIRHVAVRNPDGRLFDIRGYIEDEEMGTPFSYEPPHDIRDVAVSDLEAEAHTQPYTIERARRVAETLWPELPWKETFASRVVAYADEIEAISRKHGFWIYAPLPNPNSAPPLAIGEGDEGGYDLRPTIGGFNYLISRYLVPRT